MAKGFDPKPLIKQIKDIGWTEFLGTAKEYKGAVQEYTTADGKTVAVGFALHDAFIVRDDDGLFRSNDLKKGIFLDKDIDIMELGMVSGVESIAWEDQEDREYVGTVSFNEKLLTSLGINDFAVRESLTTRILAIAKLDVTYNPFEAEEGQGGE